MPLDVARRGTLDVRDPPLRAIVAANDNYEEGYHKGNAGGLDAIDTDLAPGNIKDTVTIFGKLGTLEATLIDDILGEASSALLTTSSSGAGTHHYEMSSGEDYNIATKTQSYAAGSRACSVAFALCRGQASSHKLRHFMAGVQVEETAYLSVDFDIYILSFIKAMSGSQICKLDVHNYYAGDKTFSLAGEGGIGDPVGAGIAIGSMKT